jgi:predicted transcriptional regulator
VITPKIRDSFKSNLKKLKKTQTDFCKEHNVDYTGFFRILKGQRSPGFNQHTHTAALAAIKIAEMDL